MGRMSVVWRKPPVILVISSVFERRLWVRGDVQILAIENSLPFVRLRSQPKSCRSSTIVLEGR